MTMQMHQNRAWVLPEERPTRVIQTPMFDSFSAFMGCFFDE